MDIEALLKELRDEHKRVGDAIKMLEAMAAGKADRKPGSGRYGPWTPEQRAEQGEKIRAYWAKKKATKKAAKRGIEQ